MTTPANPRKRKPSENELYQLRVIDGVCVRGCGRRAEDDSNYCERCGPAVMESRAAGQRAQRAARRAAGLCVDCGEPAPKKTKHKGGGHKRRCRACTKARRKQGDDRAKPGVDRDPMIAVDAQRHALESRTWKDAENRTRYHGRDRRGPPTRSDTDSQDLKYMRDTLEKAEVAFRESLDPEIQEAPPIQRDAWRRRWLGQVALLGRFIDDVLDRGKWFESDPKIAKARR